MENLHEAIVREILYKLPVESILRCIQVCKTRRSLVRNAYFVNNHYLQQLRLLHHEQQLDVDNHHATKSNVSLGQIFLIEKGNFRFQYVDENWDCKTNNNIGHGRFQPFDRFYKKLLTTISDSDNNIYGYYLYPIGSCNGLVCFCFMYDCQHFMQVPFSLLTYPMFVCNPVTGEYVNLPRCGAKEKDFPIGIMSGIGYDYSNNVYKVVVAIHNMLELQLDTSYRLQVYTLGDVNGWRNIKIPYDISGECIHIEGSSFWIHGDRCNIDLTNEVFELLLVPPFHNPKDTYYKKLHILRNRLCVVLNHCQNLEIWSVKKRKRKSELSNNSSMVKKRRRKLELNNNSSSIEESTDCWSWIKELSIPLEGLGKFRYMS
ncbi:uncharacterized protein LOC113325197 [Papaver somniferum]|uniref:uncharacterized protein LOC113325197 n=1 Tax=Papaver somniferum TaxID=3469 RepID=UPI000E705840|nr:uncharacterized protein LOC113325197 [Papaver somniferum]